VVPVWDGLAEADPNCHSDEGGIPRRSRYSGRVDTACGGGRLVHRNDSLGNATLWQRRRPLPQGGEHRERWRAHTRTTLAAVIPIDIPGSFMQREGNGQPDK